MYFRQFEMKTYSKILILLSSSSSHNSELKDIIWPGDLEVNRFFLNAFEYFYIMMIMKGNDMPETEYHHKVIMYPV